MAYCEEIIDLTDSFCLSSHRSLADTIIELDDSMTGSFNDVIQQVNADCPDKHVTRPREQKKSLDACKNRQTKIEQFNKQTKEVRNKTNSTAHSSWGECPICWDPLGRNPLASTKCGHVYCMKCLENSLKWEQKCPTCRHVLKGKSAYHPLYLN